MISWLQKKVFSRNPFELGISMSAYYAVVFLAIPILSFVGLGVVGVTFRWDVWVMAILGLTGMILGYWTIGRRISWKGYWVLSSPWNMHRAQIIFFLSLCLGLLAKCIRIFGGGYYVLRISPEFAASRWYSLLGVLDLFGAIALLFAWCIAYTLQEKADLRWKRWKWISWGLLVLELVYAIPTCKRLSIIFPLLLVLIVQSFLSRMSWIKIGLVFAAILFLVFPLGNLCRNPGAFIKYPSPPPLGQPAMDISPHISPLFFLESFLTRLNYYHLMGYIIDAQDPPLWGKHFSDFFVSLGPPRFLWKNKPTIGIDGNAFGRHVGVLSPDDIITSVGPNVVGDLYMNFRFPGVFFGMMLLGLLWRGVYEILIVRTRHDENSAPSLSGVFLYAIVWTQIMRGFEDPIAPMYAGLVKIFIILFALVWFISDKNNSKNTNEFLT